MYEYEIGVRLVCFESGHVLDCHVHAVAFGADKLPCCLLVGVVFEHALAGVGCDAV